MNRNIYWLGALVGLMAISACGDDASATTETDTESSSTSGDETTTSSTDPTTTAGETMTMTTMGPSTGPTDPDTTDTTGPPPEPADFFVRIENISTDTVLPGPLSPGLWLEHGQGSMPIFSLNEADRGEGLVEIAEDGDPSGLETSMMSNGDVIQVATWTDPILPGEMLEFEFTAQPFSRLSLVTMLVASNDIFVGSGPNGISIFDNTGFPQDERDVTMNFRFWDVGSEYNQAPGQGPDQALLGGAPNIGMDEAGQVVAHNSSTRALPLARAMFAVEVAVNDLIDTQLDITITNISDDPSDEFNDDKGTLVSGFSPLIWARHTDSQTLFDLGADGSSVTGLQELAEDGDPAVWFADLDGNLTEVATIDVPTAPGESFEINVTPDATDRFLSFATMIVETNDVILATPPGGIELADDAGALLDTNDIRVAIERQLALIDAGTEANEVPGRGANIATRQDDVNTGPDDPDTAIRFYNDATNDLATTGTLGGMLSLTITPVGGQDGDFDIVLTKHLGRHGVRGDHYPAGVDGSRRHGELLRYGDGRIAGRRRARRGRRAGWTRVRGQRHGGAVGHHRYAGRRRRSGPADAGSVVHLPAHRARRHGRVLRLRVDDRPVERHVRRLPARRHSADGRGDAACAGRYRHGHRRPPAGVGRGHRGQSVRGCRPRHGAAAGGREYRSA